MSYFNNGYESPSADYYAGYAAAGRNEPRKVPRTIERSADWLAGYDAYGAQG